MKLGNFGSMGLMPSASVENTLLYMNHHSTASNRIKHYNPLATIRSMMFEDALDYMKRLLQ
jgi:isocitrate/isopropylmalate dehydrogenase